MFGKQLNDNQMLIMSLKMFAIISEKNN
jgi:hypothetical protein